MAIKMTILHIDLKINLMIMAKILEIRIINDFNDRGSVVSNVISTIGVDAGAVEAGKPLPFRLMDGSYPSVEYFDGEYLEMVCGGHLLSLRKGGPAVVAETSVVPGNIHVHETKKIVMRLLSFSPVRCSDYRGMFRRGSVNSVIYNYLTLLNEGAAPDAEAEMFFRMVFWSRENMFLLENPAVDLLKTAAVNGNSAALFGYGRYVLSVRRSVDWADIAARCFRDAASRGFADALAELSQISRFGDLGVVDYGKADSLMDRALAAGSSYAWRVHLQHLIYGCRGVQKSPVDALVEVTRLLDSDPDNPWWHYLRGEALSQTGDTASAASDLEFAARAGLSAAWPDVALAVGCDADFEITDMDAYKAALHWGAEGMDASCIWALAQLDMEDCEGDPDYVVRMKADKYVRLMKRVFELGSTLGAVSLGDFYADGEYCTSVDIRKAWGWYAKAAQLGSSDAYERMYRMMLHGQVKKDRGFRNMCALLGVRLGSDRLLREVVAAAKDGSMAPYITEIEKYYVPLLRKLEQEGNADLDIDGTDDNIAGDELSGEDYSRDDDGRYDAYV